MVEKTTMTSSEISQSLQEIATLLELKGENAFKVRAYQNAARLLETLEIPLSQFVADAQAGKIKGIGEALQEKIATLYHTGSLPYLQELRDEFPPGLLELFQVPGLGGKKIKMLYDSLHISSISDLKEACEQGKLSGLKGFGEKTEQNILAGIHRLSTYAGKFLYPDAYLEAQAIGEILQQSGLVLQLEIAGSLRRKKEIVGDIDLLVTSKKPKEVMNLFVSLPQVASSVAHGETKSSVVLKSGINADLRVVSEQEFPAALLYFTGSKEHNTLVRGIAKNKGYKLNEYGLFRGEHALKMNSETEIYEELGLCFIPPEVRETQGELEFAEKAFSHNQNFPTFVQDSDLVGVLHTHTTYSDGKNTLRDLAQAVRAMGYQYLGVSDHSQSAAYAGGLKIDAIKRQHEEIDLLNEQLKPFYIFKGIESDILAEGALDYKDNVLETFDFVIASIHSSFSMTEQEMTKRIIRAVSHPATTILGHPTGRLLLERDGYAVDIPAVLDACHEHGVAVELNANPLRLDLDWRYLKRAKELGIAIPINPDAHSIDQVAHMSVGVGIARKGWLEKKNVLNTYTTAQLKQYFLDRKGKPQQQTEKKAATKSIQKVK